MGKLQETSCKPTAVREVEGRTSPYHASADVGAASSSPEDRAQIIHEGGCTKQQTFSVGETAFYWKETPSRTFTAGEERSMPGFKAAKDRLTPLIGARAAGACQMKPVLSGHSGSPRALGNHA